MVGRESVHQPLPTSFLDAILTEVVEHILRFLSHLPEAENWDRHIPLIDLAPLFRISHHLWTYTRLTFNQILKFRRLVPPAA